jgi:hypothetical protein
LFETKIKSHITGAQTDCINPLFSHALEEESESFVEEFLRSHRIFVREFATHLQKKKEYEVPSSFSEEFCEMEDFEVKI